MENTHTLQWKYQPCFELPENSVSRLHKAQWRNWHYGSVRLWVLHVPLKTQNWKANELQNMSRNTYEHRVFSLNFLFFFPPFFSFFFLLIFVCWKFMCTKYSQIIQVNTSAVCMLGEFFITPPHGQPHAIFWGFISTSGGWMLVYKELNLSWLNVGPI